MEHWIELPQDQIAKRIIHVIVAACIFILAAIFVRSAALNIRLCVCSVDATKPYLALGRSPSKLEQLPPDHGWEDCLG